MRSARTFLTAVAVVLGALAFTASPASAGYQHYQTDSYNFSTSNSAVKAVGTVNWYRDGGVAGVGSVYRGQYTGSVKLQRAGCLHAQVQWKTVSGTVSWPPSGSSSTTSTGYYRKCGPAGTTLSLAGIAHSSRTLYRTCLNLGYSSSASAARSYNSNHCMLS